MPTNDPMATYDRLSREDQARFLAYLAHETTLAIRGCYSDAPQIVSSLSHSRVGNLNEVQHRVLGYLNLVLEDVPDPPSGEKLVSGLLEWARMGSVEAELVYALHATADRF